MTCRGWYWYKPSCLPTYRICALRNCTYPYILYINWIGFTCMCMYVYTVGWAITQFPSLEFPITYHVPEQELKLMTAWSQKPHHALGEWKCIKSSEKFRLTQMWVVTVLNSDGKTCFSNSLPWLKSIYIENGLSLCDSLPLPKLVKIMSGKAPASNEDDSWSHLVFVILINEYQNKNDSLQ